MLSPRENRPRTTCPVVGTRETRVVSVSRDEKPDGRHCRKLCNARQARLQRAETRPGALTTARTSRSPALLARAFSGWCYRSPAPAPAQTLAIAQERACPGQARTLPWASARPSCCWKGVQEGGVEQGSSHRRRTRRANAARQANGRPDDVDEEDDNDREAHQACQ